MTESRGALAAQADHASWYALPVGDVLARLETDERGLSEREAARRRARYGSNTLRVARPVPAWKVLLDQVKSLIVLLLFAAAGVALAIGDLLEAAAIGAVLLINVVIGFWMEWRARQAMEALRRMEIQRAVVIRDGRERPIDARDLVPGDLLVLEAGSAIAADARVLAANELRVVEAPLTGESVPVSKSPDPVRPIEEDEEVPLAERTSMVYKGTLAAAGDGRAVVVATGRSTEIGRITELVQEADAEKTPLERRLDRLGHRLVWITLVVAAVVSGVGLVRGEELWLMVETGIALAIAAVPEGLPVVATITLAVGMRRMARRRALVRRLPAVETLGSATVVCTDKTGTLTAGEMTVSAYRVAGAEVEVTGAGYEPRGEFRRDGRRADPRDVPGLELALRIGVLASRASVEPAEQGFRVRGDPTEAALLVAGRKAGLERARLRAECPEVAEVPFSSERMWMATFHERPEGGLVAYVKGAPERVVERSARALSPEGTAPLDDAGREALLEAGRRMADRGLRVLGLAVRELDWGGPLDETAVRDLTFVGFVGMMDPPAPGVRETIARLRAAGVRTVMITGDHAVTAAAVARELGILGPEDEAIDSRALGRLSDDELARRAHRITTFSRVAPEAKLRIVEAYRRSGEVVAMLGDGVNDAPALKRADIGVAMGIRGTDVAKETAALVLQDDRFETIGVAVEQGRVIFDNIRKFVFYLFSCNLSEVLVLFVAGAAGWPLPLLPLQILWLNLITDVFPALALAMEPAEPDVMRRPPRDPESTILSRSFLSVIGGYGALLTAATLGAFLWAGWVWEAEARHAGTVAFMTLALGQLFHVFNARSPEPILFTRRLLGNPWAWGAVALTVALQLAAVYVPFLREVLDTRALAAADWALVAAASVLPLAVGQLWKISPARRAGETEPSSGGESLSS